MSRHAPMPGIATALMLALALGGCGDSGKRALSSVPAAKLANSLKSVLIAKYHVDPRVSVDCGTAIVVNGHVVSCDAVSSAGMGYSVSTSLPCWTATFNGKIIEGPGFAPPSARPKSFPTGPSNLPNQFNGCVT